MLSVPASAAIITFTNMGLDLGGQGFGNDPPMLTLQPKGNATVEPGSVLWNGRKDVLTGDAEKNKSRTFTAGALLDQGVTAETLGIIFNINEPGPTNTVNLSKFVLTAYSPSGSIIFSATYNGGPGGLDLASYDGGQGNAGWLFSVRMTDAEFARVFGNRNNRLGLSVPSDAAISNVHGGAEDFRIVPAAGAVSAPEPATACLLILGATGILGCKMRRSARPQA